MTLMELAGELKRMYKNAANKEKAAMIHLFGIRYAKEIENSGVTAKDIVLAAGMYESYHTEVHKGMRLAKYVAVKDSALLL